MSLALAIISGFTISSQVLAETKQSNNLTESNRTEGEKDFRGANMMKPTVFGTVSSINGNIITIMGKQFTKNKNETTDTTYTADATNAAITKAGNKITISGISVGDTIAVQGALDGTNIVAKSIRDGLMFRDNEKKIDRPKIASSTPAISGNGQPVIAGTISTINGNTLTISNKSNITYSIDISSAKIVQGQNTITTSDLLVGDSVIVQGTITGTSVTATSVIDQKLKTQTSSDSAEHKGFFSGIGNFFSHLFGF